EGLMGENEQRKNNQLHNKSTTVSLLPGLLLCLIVILVGIFLAEQLGNLFILFGILPEGSASPVSGIFVAIIIGIIIRNTIGLQAFWQPGIAFAVKYALRAGIVLLGLRLSLKEALKLVGWCVLLIIICITSVLFITLYVTNKLGQSNRLSTLIAGGTGICGVTSIMAISPVIKAKDNAISYAVANITIFGLTSMLLYPYFAH